MEIKHFLTNNNIEYNSLDIYIEAFTHMSYVNENKDDEKEYKSYQRLEFLGDAILSQVVATYIYKNYFDMEPGDMTLLRSYLVNKNFLSSVGKELNFDKYIQIGKGKQEEILSDAVYEDVFESVIGAIYLDAGYNAVKNFIIKNICQKIVDIDITDLKDYKTKLQEFLQSSHGKTVRYLTTSEKTKDGNMIFNSTVTFDDQNLGSGSGNSKKLAEQRAAKSAYNRMVK